MLRIELKRAFKSRSFYVAMLIGLVIALGQYFENVAPMVKYLDMDFAKNVYPHSVFNKWMGSEYYTVWPMLFYFILPVLAVLPHGDSFYSDIQTGYIKNIFVRVEKKRYLKAKLVAVYLSGMTTVMFPLVVNLLLAAVTLPALAPAPSTGFFFIFDQNMWSELFLTHPWVYTIIYIFLDGIFGGLFACIALAGTLYVSGKFVAAILPFTVQITVYVIAMSFPELSPVGFLSPAQPVGADVRIILLEIIAAAAAIYLLYYRKGIKDEMLE